VVNLYVTIEDVLRARTADFVKLAHRDEGGLIDMLQNEP
jgi:hypothetical protein